MRTCPPAGFGRAGFILPAAIILAITVLAGPAEAQQFSLDLGSEAGPLSGRILQLVALITIITLAPSLLVVVTSFTRIGRSLAAQRHGRATPPNAVLIVSRCF